MDAGALRRFYARLVTARGGVENPRVIDAFARVKREAFVGPGPWLIQEGGAYISTETEDPAVLYQDILVALVPERGINNGEPSLHARCMDAAAPTTGDVVVHVGTGTGYYTAILAELVGPAGRVYAYEIDAGLASRAAANLAGYANLTVRAQSALEGPLPTADVIYVSAGATHVPGVWLDALARGGRLVLPLTPHDGVGCMLRITRLDDTRHAASIFSTAGFIPCVGARDDTQSRALAAALRSKSTDDVRSLHRGTPPDDTAWCVGDGWWLSTEDPTRSTSQRTASLNDPPQHADDGQHQENVNQPSEGIGRPDAEQPQDDEHDDER